MNSKKKTPFDNLAQSLTKKEVERKIPKTETIQLRVSKADKESIKKTAQKNGLTTTDYLIRCHYLVSEKLE